MWQSRWFAQLLHKWSENSGNKSSRNIREKEESWDSTWKVVICWQKKAAVIWRLLFQYALPCGSDSRKRYYLHTIYFNTHSPAGVILLSYHSAVFTHFNTHSLAGVIPRRCICNFHKISIRTPLREWFGECISFIALATFQYALPCGSDSSHSWQSRYNTFQYALPCGSDSIYVLKRGVV